MREIEALLAERLGFDAASVGRDAVANAIRRAMHAASVADVGAYARRLVHDAESWESLVERVVVPETSFFRDGAPFEFAADAASAAARDSAAPFRILSCPCSSGEEPYSLAMALDDRGVPPGTFTITAVDISRRSTRLAREGRYRASSFRGGDLAYRTRHFHKAGDHAWSIDERVRAGVTFETGNVVDPGFLSSAVPFDLIFCRNLLIYLHPRARAVAMSTIRRLLAPGGALVVGHAESGIAREHGFHGVDRPGAFAFRAEAGAKRAPASVPRPAAAGRAPQPRVAPAPARAARPHPAPLPRALPPEDDAEAARLLVRAEELADRGQLAEALACCEAHLARRRDSADGYFLMGVVRDAMGERPQAIALLKKALYLDPAHVDALRQLALAHEAAGDQPGAALLRARARRADELVRAD
jgi:chemotaxis protein methyltransferase WspC